MRLFLGKSLRGLGMAAYWIFGIIGSILSLAVVEAAAGFWGFVIAFVVFPVTFTAAPWYALVKWGNPWPLVFSYGGIIVAWIFVSVGTGVIRSSERHLVLDR